MDAVVNGGVCPFFSFSFSPVLRHMQDLRSPTRDRTQALDSENVQSKQLDSHVIP